MTAQNKTTIKSYFETGDKPTSAQFANLIDSYQDTTASLVTLSSASVGTVGLLLLAAATSAAALNTIGALTSPIANSSLATMNANTVKANATAGVATPTDFALSASTVLGMGSSGNIAALTPSSPISIGASSIALNMLPITNSLSGDVTITTAGTYYDGPSIAQGSVGTWAVNGTITVQDSAGATLITAKLWDGTTVIASCQTFTQGATNPLSLALSGYLASPAGNLRISVTSGRSGSTVIKNTASGLSKDSTISAIRIG